MTLADALERRGVRFRRSPGDPEKLHINCCFCESRGKPADTKQRLCVHARDGWGRCLHCDWRRPSGHAVAAVLRELGIADAVSGGSTAALAEPESEPVRLPDDFTPLDGSDGELDELDRKALRYVLGRGVSPLQVARRSIGASYVGEMAYRVVFPVMDEGRLVGLNGRDFTGRQDPKYLLSRGMSKPLYGFDPERETVVLSEGVIKSLRIARVTPWGSAALLGHDLTARQAEQLRGSRCRRVVIWPDPDPVGRRGALKVADALRESGWAGDVQLVWPAPAAADDAPWAELTAKLALGVRDYDFRLRAAVLTGLEK